jgi:hypothetical protein
VTTSGSERLTGISDSVFKHTSVFYLAAKCGRVVYAKCIEDEFFREV